jgi:dephospho-CoA kinase
VAVVFVTGMSGTGKSAALAELARRGHRVVDTDYGGYARKCRPPTRAAGSSYRAKTEYADHTYATQAVLGGSRS